MRQTHKITSAIAQIILVGSVGLTSLLANAQSTKALSSTTNSTNTVSVADKSAESPTKGLLFEIKSGDKTAYLFGSIHIAKADFYPMSPKVDAAYAQADTLAIEADATDQAEMMKYLPKLMYSGGDKLQNHLTADTWNTMVGMVGPQAEQMQMFKPAMAAMSIAMGAASVRGYLPEFGIDAHYINRAKNENKKIVELESVEFQVDMLASLSDSEGDSMMADIFNSFKDKSFFTDLDSLVNTWKSADADAMAKMLNESNNKDAGSKKIAKLMFDDRNEGMAEKIKTMINSDKKLFIVVGAGHLAGEKSIVDLLQKQGLQVTQIK